MLDQQNSTNLPDRALNFWRKKLKTIVSGTKLEIYLFR